MESIVDIKSRFNDLDVLKVYADCVYMPTQEKLLKQAANLMSKPSVSIFGFCDNEKVIGVIAVDQLEDGTAVIRGIAADPEHRKRGIGKQLVQHVCKALPITELHAETHEGAVEFYQKCGFETERFLRKFDSGEYVRYRCVLHVNR